MRKIMMGMIACTLGLASCSVNEMMDSAPARGQSDGSIKFGVNTPVTRAVDLWDNGNFAENTRTFKVVGRTVGANPKDYLGSFTTPRDVTFDGSEWSYTDKLYWPAASLNFFTWYMTDTDADVDAGTAENTMKVTGFKVNPTIGSQEDFLVGAGQYDKEEISTIYLKHALTKILFKAEVLPLSQLKVTINDVAIYNLNDKGDLTVTSLVAKTDPTMIWGNLSSTVAYSKNQKYAIGTFGNNEKVLTAPTSGTTPNAAFLHAGTDETAPRKEDAMLLMPQTFKAWEPLTQKIADNNGALLTGSGDPLLTSNNVGSFIGISCKIEAVDLTGTAVEYIYGHVSAFKQLFIPVSSVAGMYGEWKANRAITYVITFGDTGSGSGGGGWTGDDGDGDGKIDPVLVPINFRVEVSAWDEFDVILQSVNFNSTGLNNATFPTKLTEQTDMCLTEAANNPQKKYDAKFNLAYGSGSQAGDLDLTTGSVATSFAKYADNNKFLANSKITVTVTGDATAGWHADGIKFPTILGWKADPTDCTLKAAGSVTYTKTAMATIEPHRLNAMKSMAIMTVNGTPAASTSWDHSSATFAGLKNSGEYAALNFVDLKGSEEVEFIVGVDFKVVAVAAVKDADFTGASTTAKATASAKYLVIKKD